MPTIFCLSAFAFTGLLKEAYHSSYNRLLVFIKSALQMNGSYWNTSLVRIDNMLILIIFCIFVLTFIYFLILVILIDKTYLTYCKKQTVYCIDLINY